MAYTLCADHHHAEDLVQTALTRTYSRWDRLHDQDPLRYAQRIIVNANHDRWRRHRGREQLVDVPIDVATTRDHASESADRATVQAALLALTSSERSVVALRLLADQSEAQTADELGISVGAVRSSLHRAIAKLRTGALGEVSGS